MPLALLTRRRLMLFALEGTAGTAESVPSTAIHVEDVAFTENTEFLERPGTLYMGPAGGVGGARSGTITFTVRCTTKGSDTEPDWFALVQACAIIDATGPHKPSSVPPGSGISRPAKTATIWFYEDGRRQSIAGAVGNCVLRGVAGGQLFAEFTFTGKHTIQSAVALPAPTFPSNETLLRVASGVFTIAGDPFTLGEFSIDLGNQTMLIPSTSDATGYYHGLVTDRRVNGTLNVLAEAIDANYAPQTWKQAGTTKAVVIGCGTGAGRLTISIPALQVIDPVPTDRDGNVADALGFVAMRGDAGDDDLSLTWEAS